MILNCENKKTEACKNCPYYKCKFSRLNIENENENENETTENYREFLHGLIDDWFDNGKTIAEVIDNIRTNWTTKYADCLLGD
jgi:hypothetical protein